jgi:hypothetical protein
LSARMLLRGDKRRMPDSVLKFASVSPRGCYLSRRPKYARGCLLSDLHYFIVETTANDLTKH